MYDQFAKYTNKLISERSALSGHIAFAAQDDHLVTDGEPTLARLAGDVLGCLNALGLVAARPSLPFADFLVRRAHPDENSFIPRDTETRTFLHDIPFLRSEEITSGGTERLARLLGSRKGVIVEGVGI